MALLIILGLLVLILFGLGFAIKWLFIAAVVAAIVWLITAISGGFGRTT